MNKLENVEFKVAGVTFDNDNGINRQTILASMTVASKVTLEREPMNPYDINAIAVLHEGEHIGYVGKQYAKILAPMMDSGKQFVAKVLDVDSYKSTYYCKILVSEV